MLGGLTPDRSAKHFLEAVVQKDKFVFALEVVLDDGRQAKVFLIINMKLLRIRQTENLVDSALRAEPCGGNYVSGKLWTANRASCSLM